VAPRRGCGSRTRPGAFAGEEEPAGAAVTELAVQGRDLLQADRPMGVAHLVSLSVSLTQSLSATTALSISSLIRASYAR
jgi:hypothetical protein